MNPRSCESEAEPPSVSCRMRRLTEADIPFACEVRALAGWNQTERDWEGYLRFEPEGCFLAEVNGARAGTATTLRYDGVLGWIGMVLVHPSMRRRGVGSALLRECIAYLQACGVRCIKLDATPMGRAVYLPMGFQDEYEIVRYRGGVPRETARAFAPVQPLTDSAIDAVSAFDASVFGLPRRHVLADLHQRDPGFSFLVESGGEVAGYVIARAGAHEMQLGPMVATSVDWADALLCRVVTAMPGKCVLVDVPVPNAAGRTLFERHGFVEQRRFTRMYLGENLAPGQPELVFGGAGAEKG